MPKEFLSSIAIVLTFVAFVPYIRSISQGKTRPHVFSWVIWGVTTSIVFFAQVADKGGAGAWPTAVSSLVTFYVAFLAYKNKSGISITKMDWVFFVMALASLPLWFFTSDPLWAVVILTTVDLCGMGPTFRKAYWYPFEEQLMFFGIVVVRDLFVISALEHYSVTTVLFPAAIAIQCTIFIAMVSTRRKALSEA